MIRVLQNEIQDLQRIIDADEAILSHEKSAEKRHVLLEEIARLEDKIATLKKQADFYRNPD
jgi:uncharacterized protein (DUF2344 family)